MARVGPSSVSCWLRELRYSTESYEKQLPVAEEKNNRIGGGSDRRLFDYEDGESGGDRVLLRSRSESGNNGNRAVAKMTDVERCRRYAYVREKTVGEGVDFFDIKHAKVCRVSFAFEECAEELQVVPVVIGGWECDVSEDVMSWKRGLRTEYSSEDDGEEPVNHTQVYRATCLNINRCIFVGFFTFPALHCYVYRRVADMLLAQLAYRKSSQTPIPRFRRILTF